MKEHPRQADRFKLGDDVRIKGHEANWRTPTSVISEGPGVILLLLVIVFFALVPRMAHTAPRISEFMAKNETTIADEDGDFSDWIEIYNPDSTPFDLSGCYLSDDSALLTQWQFPANTLIESGEFLIIFASEKNRTVAGSELHTNFKLKAGAGNYIALIAADSTSILNDYTYPDQEEDISFGVSQQIVPVPLVAASNPEILIPQTANDLPADWNSQSHIPGANWISGTAATAVGYDTSEAPVPLKNISLSGTASQSTSHAAGPADNGNDGNTGNFTHTLGNDSNAWWQVEFPSDEEIHEVVLHNRDNCCHVRFRDLTIEVRDAGGSVLYTSPILNPENVSNGPELIEWDIAADNGGPVTGRIVRVRRTADPDASGQGAAGGSSDANVLALGEVFVMVPDPDATGGEGEENLALKGSAIQSSTLSAFGAELAIDNDLGNFTHTFRTDNAPEWTLQLAHRSILSEITIHNRDACCGHRMRDITVEVLDSNGSTTFLSGLLNPEDVDGSPELINLDLVGITGDPVIAKTVIIRRTPDPDFSGQGGSGSADDAVVISLGEVEVTGEAIFGFTSFINDDIEAEALGKNASAFLRIPFEVDDPSLFEFLTLKMRYDDGFVAYLNGMLIASGNAPASPAWNSAALEERDSAEAFQFEDIEISQFLPLLNSGTNILAIQMLNSNASDADFFMQPRLITSKLDVNDSVYLSKPTPGAGNDSEWYFDRVGSTQFSHARGFYDDPFFVTLTSLTPGAQIRFTTDGNAPTETSGTLYTDPIEIEGTTVLRTLAFFNTFRSTNVETHTYIFRDDVIASPEMQTSVTQDPTYGPQMRDALLDLPTISLAFPGDIDRAEKPSSVELMGFEDGDLQVNAGMSRFGSYVTNFTKRNIRLAFRGIYGPKKLKYPLFQGHGRDLRPVDVFDQLDLRTGSHDMVARGFYMSNRFLDDTFLDMGHINPHGRFVHVYINGSYWGMYHLRERWNADMHANYLGGKKENYEAVASNRGGGSFSAATPYDGDGSAWANVKSLGNNYDALKDYLDMPQFVDFMLMLMSGNSEAEHRAVSPLGAGSGFILYYNDGDGFTRNPPNRTGHAGPDNLFSSLRSQNHPDFRTLMADRIQKHYFNGGLMTPGPATERLLQRTTQIERAFLAEAARWNYRSPDSWTTARDNYIANILSSLDQTVIAQLQAAGLLPATAAPQFSQHGGEVSASFSLGISTSTSGTVFVTTDGSDPRLPGGAVSTDAAPYTNPLTLTNNAFVRARTRNGSEWSGLTEAFFTIAGNLSLTSNDIAISELHYNPDTGSENTEFLEILNISTRPVNLRNTRFSDGVEFNFPTKRDTILSPGERIVLANSLYHLNTTYGTGIPVVGIYEGSLNNDGEMIRFEQSDGTVISEFTYNDSETWPSAPDGRGPSLTLVSPEENPDGNNPFHWRSSSIVGGTPGEEDSGGPNFPDARVLVNEVLTHTDLPELDSIELYNPGPENVDLGGWFLTDDISVPQKFRIPDDTTLSVGAYLVFDESEFNTGPNAFRLSEHGEQAYLFSADAGGTLSGYSHGLDFKAAPNGITTGRHVDSRGKTHIVLQASNTLGAANSAPLVGPVVISEIHYRPTDLSGGIDNSADEFIELSNTSSLAVPLYDTDTSAPGNSNATWQLRNAVDYDFPSNVVLNPGERILVVGFDPATDTAQTASLRSKFEIPEGVEIYGPWSGKLGNSGEEIELKFPGSADPEAAFIVPYYTVEEIDYRDSNPWPDEANGNGSSLQRINFYEFGNDPENWRAENSPGKESADSDDDGMDDSWEMIHGLIVGVDDSNLDLDSDGRTNIDEYHEGTSPSDPGSFLDLSIVETASGLILRFTANPNKGYLIQYSVSLTPPANWTTLQEVSAETEQREIQIDVEASGPRRFYRVIATPGE